MVTKKRAVALIGACFFAIFGLSACAEQYRTSDSRDEEVDETKTQLYVQNFDGGFGSDWLYALAERFEEFYRDESFEEGKTGIQIHISKAKTDGMSLLADLDATSAEVFFNESVYYYDYLAQDKLLDITDIMTENLSEFGEEGTIEGKMTDEQKAYYQSDKKYYGIPHYAGYNGIVYDKDLFDLYNLYFKNVPGKSVLIDSETDEKSAGPDGKLGTSDDGFPATYEEFFQLCDAMIEMGITPFVWAGQYYDTYVEKVMYALCVDCEGLEQTMLNYTFGGAEGGTATNLIGEVNENDGYEKLAPLKITTENAYNLWRSEGKYLSMKFFERVVKNKDYYTKNVFSPAHLYTEAQKDFIESRAEGEPIAMILEGCWWENEAKSVIQECGDRNGEEYAPENRHFGMMPFPKASQEDVGEKSTIVDTHYSLGFIKKSIDPSKIKAAKKFLKFACTNQSLNEFTVYTNTVKALKYTMTEENLDKLTYFGKSVYELHNSSDIFYPYSPEKVYLDNQSRLSVHNSYYSIVNGGEKARPITYMRENVNNGAEEYFNGMYVYQLRNWENVYGRYYD